MKNLKIILITIILIILILLLFFIFYQNKPIKIENLSNFPAEYTDFVTTNQIIPERSLCKGTSQLSEDFKNKYNWDCFIESFEQRIDGSYMVKCKCVGLSEK